MPSITFRRPTIQPLKRAGTCVPSSTDFCVTQHFDSPDYYWSNVPNPPSPLPTHRAMDIGNFRCGYPIVAMAAGIARRIKDNATALGAPNDALGVEVVHRAANPRVTSEYWHLAGWTISDGQSVTAGQQIGVLGNTGLGQVCHTHVEVKVDGVKIDPEPLAFGGSLIFGEEPVVLPDFQPLATGIVPGGNNLRAKPTRDSDAYLVEYQRTFDVLGVVRGGTYTIGGKTGDQWVALRGEKVWFAALPLVDIRPTAEGTALLPAPAPAPTGFTQADIDAAKAAGRAAGIKAAQDDLADLK